MVAEEIRRNYHDLERGHKPPGLNDESLCGSCTDGALPHVIGDSDNQRQRITAG